MNHSSLLEELEKEQLRSDMPEFDVGDSIKVFIRLTEGDKERIQIFAGTVIARRGSGISSSFSVYRIAYGSAMERVFPLHSPQIAKIELVSRGKVRRSKLYYLRGAFGKAARVKGRHI